MTSQLSQKKRDYIWNTAAGLINAAEAVVMSMIVTRITGLADAGMLTIAFAIGNLMMTVGKFGVRNYQVTDIENRFSFSVYLKTRLATILLMIIVVSGYLVYAFVELQYSPDKIMIIGMICMIYAVEALEDVFWGYYQRRDRMDAGAKMFCVRWLGILAVFMISLWISRNLGFTLLICLIVSLMLLVLMLCLFYGKICGEEDRKMGQLLRSGSLREMQQLIRAVFALFGITFLTYYVNNAPKYAIDACLPEEIQACYGFVAMPVFVIGLLSTFVYQPTLLPMALEWEGGQRKIFVNRVLKQMGVVGVLSVICMAGAYVIGIPALSWLYHAELSAYKRELMILMAAGGFVAVSGYLSVVLTTMRCQMDLLWPYGLIALLAAIGLKGIVSRYGTMGAAVCYLILLMLLSLIYSVILAVRLAEKRKGDLR